MTAPSTPQVTFNSRITGITIIQLPGYPNAISTVEFAYTATDSTGGYYSSVQATVPIQYSSLLSTTTTSTIIFTPFENLTELQIIDFVKSEIAEGRFNLNVIKDQLIREIDSQRYFASKKLPIDFPWN